MFRAMFNSKKRRQQMIDDIPKTIEESYEKDMKSIESDWIAVLGDFYTTVNSHSDKSKPKE